MNRHHVLAVVILALAACGGEPSRFPTRAPIAKTTPIAARIRYAAPFPSAAPTNSFCVVEFAWNRDHNHDIYVMDSDGSGQTRLTDDPALDTNPIWSPDGRRIAFQSYRDGNDEIYLMNADGSEQTNLTNNPGRDSDPAWSPDGARIAFESKRDGNVEIYVMNAVGSGQTKLTNGRGCFDFDMNPAWSPDGTRIAFNSTHTGCSCTHDHNTGIWVMDADGSGQTKLTNSRGSQESPAWSPDGTRIAFTSDRYGSYEI